MIRITIFQGQKLAVFGLGLSGRSSVQSLLAGGAEVAAWDDSDAGRIAAVEAGLTLTDLEDADWSEFAALILAPGVPLTHPEPHWTVKRARAAGVEIIGDTELFFRERAKVCPDAPVIGITGTNGKSTTTALTVHVLRAAGKTVEMGGNIGKPVLSLEPFSTGNGRVYVIEFSSYQLDLTPSLHCTAAALLNLSPDHLDRHGHMKNYAAVKARIFTRQEAGDTAVIGIDDDPCRDIADHLAGPADRVFIAAGAGMQPLQRSGQLDEAAGIFVTDGKVFQRTAKGDLLLADLAGIQSLRGTHNSLNAAFAFSLARAVGADAAATVAGFQTFPGLAHRMEILGNRGAVLFVNDSKGTNANAAEKALAAFDDIYWIAGGLSKEGGIESLAPLFSRIRKAYLVGEAADDFAGTLGGKVPFELCATLDVATRRAAEDAALSDAAEPVVLLSPACASFDQYPAFTVRGDEFRKLVDALPGMTLNPRGDH